MFSRDAITRFQLSNWTNIMFNFFQKGNQVNKARPQINNFLKRGLVFGFVFLFVSLPIFGVLQAETVSAQGGADFRADQKNRKQLEVIQTKPLPPQETELQRGGIFSTSVNSLLNAVSVVLLTVTSWSVYAAGEILNTAIKVSIIDLHKYTGSEGGVANVWKTFRDISNMFFIFILLYVAIGTILGLSNVNLKRMLARVIIVALLINFSFFFTKVIVDASNILSIGFYNQIIQTPCGSAKSVGDIGEAFMCKMGLANLWSSDTISLLNYWAGGGWGETIKIATLGFVGSIFILIAAFVFMAAAILFISRFVTLIFLFMLSPLAFAAMALPNDKYSEKWVKSLTDNCIMAPVYMATTWAVLMIIGTIAGKGGSLLEAIIGIEAGKSPETGETLFNFVIVIALMITTLIVSKQFGGYGAGGALKMLHKGRGWAQGKLGRGAVRLTAAPLDKTLAKTTFGRSWPGQQLRGVTTQLATKAKFGSKASVETVDKEKKKNQKEHLEETQKDLQKQLDKDIPGIRRELILDNESKMVANENDITRLINEIQTTENRERNNAQFGVSPDATHVASMAQLEAKKKEVENLKNKQTTLAGEIAETKQNQKDDTDVTGDENKGYATKKELAKLLPIRQRQKAATLAAPLKGWGKLLALAPSFSEDRKKLAEELRKLSRNVGQIEKKKLVELMSAGLGIEDDDTKTPPAAPPAKTT